MSDTIFILGAGASKDAGAPLMAEFLDVASNLYLTNKAGDSKESFERVFNAIGHLQTVHSKAQLNLTNIEAVFNAFELGRLIERVPGTDANDIEILIVSLKELIVTTLEQTMLFPVSQSQIQAHATYELFARLIVKFQDDFSPKHSASVITFNYDIGADVALVRAGRVPNYGLEDASQPERSSIDLLKLHGSINWASESETRTVRPIHLQKYLSHYNARSGTSIVRIGKQLKEYFAKFEKGVGVDPEPVIVPPSWNKGLYHQDLKKVWTLAARHLSEARNIFVIGYSLPETDAFFRLLYALGSVGNNPLQRFYVFDPDGSGKVDQRFRSLLGPGAELRYEYRPFKFEQAIDAIEDIFATAQSQSPVVWSF